MASQRSYTGLEQWLFLEVNALQHRLEASERSVRTLETELNASADRVEAVEQYAHELENRLDVLERAVMAQLRWNEDPSPLYNFMLWEEGVNDDIQRILDEFDEEMERAEQTWEDLLNV